MAVWSNGNPYGIKEGLIFSFPVKCDNGAWKIVPGMKLDKPFESKMIKETE